MKTRARPQIPPPGPGFAVRLGRAILFVHLLLSPLVFWPGMLDSFEIVKAALLRAMALGFATVGLYALCLRGESWYLSLRVALSRQGLAPLGFLLLLLSATLSTIFSVSPRTSFVGTPESEAGLLTVLSCTVLFLRDGESVSGHHRNPQTVGGSGDRQCLGRGLRRSAVSRA